MNVPGFGHRKNVREDTPCLHNPSLTVRSIKTNGPSRFSEIDRHRVSEMFFFLLDPGSMFKHKDNHRVQSLEKTLEGLDHLSLNLAHKFDRYPPL